MTRPRQGRARAAWNLLNLLLHDDDEEEVEVAEEPHCDQELPPAHSVQQHVVNSKDWLHDGALPWPLLQRR